MDFPFSDESVQEESLISMDEDISGAVFRTGKPWCGSVQEARRRGMKDTAQAEVERFRSFLLSAEVAFWGYSVWSNIRTLRSPATISSF